MNLVTIQWLRKCSPSLLDILKTEYSTELRNGEQIAALVPRNAKSIESLLARHASASVNVVSQVDQASHINVQQIQNARETFIRPKGKPRFQNSRRFSNLFCPGCFSLNKELKTQINFKHSPSSCLRSSAVARFLQASPRSEEDEEQEDIPW